MSLLLLFHGGGGATAYTLALDSVAWSWSATAVTIKQARKIVPDAVAWSWTITDVALRRNRLLVPESVAWSYSVTDVTLKHGFRLVPETVGWTWAATDATPKRGYALVPGSVAWSWSASDVTLVTGSNKVIAPDAVAWAWAATDVSLEHGYELVLDSAAWTWTVGDVTLTASGTQEQTTIRPTGGIPLSYEEWARRRREHEKEIEELDAPPKPRVIEKIGVAQPRTETKAFVPSPTIETGLSELTKSEIRRRARLAKRRRQEDEWFILN